MVFVAPTSAQTDNASDITKTYRPWARCITYHTIEAKSFSWETLKRTKVRFEYTSLLLPEKNICTTKLNFSTLILFILNCWSSNLFFVIGCQQKHSIWNKAITHKQGQYMFLFKLSIYAIAFTYMHCWIWFIKGFLVYELIVLLF